MMSGSGTAENEWRINTPTPPSLADIGSCKFPLPADSAQTFNGHFAARQSPHSPPGFGFGPLLFFRRCVSRLSFFSEKRPEGELLLGLSTAAD